MSLQTNDLRLSVHINAAMDDSMYHVRIVSYAEQLKPLIEALHRLYVLGEHEWCFGGRYTIGQHKIEVVEGEVQKDKVLWAFGNVREQVNSFYWNLELRGDQYFLDMNIEKNADEDARLDGTAGMTDKLPVDFWIEPAAFIRSIMGKKGAH
ncbi:hypothetical protein IB265_33070 [Ensifer sp. ENS10]|uniref:hypothetical protein n=1 Tax=Ensifer sp. ENS10 TaxID=2769286 RepID=UPI0017812D0B|nr:hypothetical protein [Ensifer sp. ENS10]MBD9511590.1 hypothetical protein [Ensifer sp. ENS10]